MIRVGRWLRFRVDEDIWRHAGVVVFQRFSDVRVVTEGLVCVIVEAMRPS